MSLSADILPSALRDLSELHAWVEANDGPQVADQLLDRLESRCLSLRQLPERGHHLPELQGFPGAGRFRQLNEGPYRIIYRFASDRVEIYAVADGRRDLAELLERRLTSP